MTWLWFHMAILKGGRRIEVSGGVGYHGPAERQRTKEEEEPFPGPAKQLHIKKIVMPFKVKR